MKLFKNHNKRVEKIKKFSGNNKIFVITALIAIVFVVYNFVFVNNDNLQSEIIASDISEQQSNEEIVEVESKRESWRFYFIDLIILGAGSGLCLIMILRQRRKTKEELK